MTQKCTSVHDCSVSSIDGEEVIDEMTIIMYLLQGLYLVSLTIYPGRGGLTESQGAFACAQQNPNSGKGPLTTPTVAI